VRPSKPAGAHDGLALEPTVLWVVTDDVTAACDEHFGPIAPVIPFADDIDSGMVHSNDQSLDEEPHVPFGGTKASGIGRYNGEAALREFTESKWVSVQRSPRRYPF